MKIVLNIKRYIFKLVKFVQLMQPEFVYAIMAIDHQMAVIQVQVGKFFIVDVLIDGGFGIYIINENLKIQLGLSR